MDDKSSRGAASQPEASSLESSNVQEVIGLLLAPPEQHDSADEPSSSADDLTESGKEDTVTVADEGGIRIASVATLDISAVALEPAISLVEHGDLSQRALEVTGIKLEDGTTAYVQATLPNADDIDDAKFINGQAVQLEDGTTAFIQTASREGLHAVQLEDGTTAYISAAATEQLFGDDTASLGLEHLTSTQTVRSVNSPKAMALGDKAFRCPYDGCGRLYTTQHHLKVHERSHTGDRPFKCTTLGCNKAFATGYGLKSHTRVHTGETPYRCPDETCNKAFKTSGDLQKHVRTHTGERPFKCPFEGCDRAFTTSNIRKVHIRTHTGERPYICREEGCGRAFASATNYKNHIRIHTGEKPYVCTVQSCGKRFTEYSSLYKHHVVHTHTKPYICTLCGKNYRQTSTLAMHKRTSHGILDGSETMEQSIDIPEEEVLEMVEETDDDLPKQSRIQFHLQPDVDDASKLVIQEGNTSRVTMVTSGSIVPSDATIVTLQANPGQGIDPNSIHEEGTIVETASGQQILVVTHPGQLVSLQQFAHHDHFTLSAATDTLPTPDESGVLQTHEDDSVVTGDID